MASAHGGDEDDNGRELPRWGTGRVEAFSDGVLVPRPAVIAYLLVAVRSALVIGAGGRLSVPWVSKQVRRIPGFR